MAVLIVNNARDPLQKTCTFIMRAVPQRRIAIRLLASLDPSSLGKKQLKC
jgi:hypothetical protein